MSIKSTGKSVRNPKSEAVMPTRRDLQFDLPAERVQDWVGNGGVHFTHLMNTMSLVIPVGERFFIDAVRHYRDQITDPELKKAATAFIGQEAMHGREHDEYNALMFKRLPSAETFERRVKSLLDFAQKNTPPSMRLSTTIALEHLTAIMANGLLQDERVTANAEPGYHALWRWHALEETEHKGVAYDVWEATQGKGVAAYVNRVSGLLMATVIFWGMVLPHFVGFVRDEKKLGDMKGWRAAYTMAIGEVGFLRRMVRPWFDYFRPGFHPWDEDNSRFLKGIEEFSATYVTPKAALAAAA
ncbi:MAG: metal-dependent hydrolase [Panacagrimonas sp.]